jgi:endonuclease/exonuclease/phosphatase family metal-dependent hydrolase
MIKVASYNIHKCVGTDRKFNPDRIIAVLAEIDADVVALQEADLRFGDKAGLLNVQALHDHLGLVPVPIEGSSKSHGWHGNVVLVREGIINKTHQLVLPGVEPRGAMVVDLTAKGVELRIIATHLGLLRRSRARQVHEVLRAAHASEGRYVLLMGDLNEWRVGKRSALSGLKPIFGPLDNFVPSFPSKFPLLALDRILCAPRGLLSHLEVHDTRLARLASDHLPIKAQLKRIAVEA